MGSRKILGKVITIGALVSMVFFVVTSVVKGGNEKVSSKTIEDVLKQHTDELMSIPGVIGTAQGVCDGKPCIKVYVKEKTPEIEQKIPGSIEGYPVSIEETGEIRAL